MKDSSTPVPEGEPQTNVPSTPAKPAGELSRSSCQQHLASAASSTDYTIRRLQKLISSSSGQDISLAAIGYSSHILHHGLSSPPSATLLARLCAFLRLQTSASQPKQSKPEPLLALSALISETRTTLRLFGLIGMWKWGSDTLKSPPSDPVLRAVTFAQIFACTAFQVLENVAHLASKGVLDQRALERWGGIERWAKWSVRAFAGHVVLQFVKLVRQQQLIAAKRRAALSASNEEQEDDGSRAAELRVWRKALVNNLAWAPLCLHWSLENGITGMNNMTGLLGFSAYAWGLSDLWRATASVAD